MTGKKYDKHKARFDLLDPAFIRSMADVMTYGAAKYEPNNWQQVDDFKARYVAALHRHLNAWQQGEVFDLESNQHHLAQIAVNAMFLFWEETNEFNDVQRCGSDVVEVYKRSGLTCKVSPEVNDVEADRESPETSEELYAKFCCICGTHLHLGAYNIYFCSRECKQKFLSSDYSPSNG